MPGRAAPADGRAARRSPSTCEHPRRDAACPRRRRSDQLADLIPKATALIEAWEARFGPYEAHPASEPDAQRLAAAWDEFGERMADNYPVLPPALRRARCSSRRTRWRWPATLAAMLVNPNNHALDGGPATSEMEKEVVDRAGGDVRARRAHPRPPDLERDDRQPRGAVGGARAASRQGASSTAPNAHYTHARMCEVLGVRARAVPADADGRIDLDALDAACATGEVGTVVLTGGHDRPRRRRPVDEALALRERHGVRLHVDAAYGGFFTLLAAATTARRRRALRGDRRCDSVVVDPHKHGLQPYGCGAVLFADPARRAPVPHDSPYTYFTVRRAAPGRDQPRVLARRRGGRRPVADAAGAAARARRGPRRVLAAGRRAALAWARAARLRGLALHLEPELDIVTYLPADDRAVRARRRQRRRARAPAWRTPTTRSS